MFRTLRWSWTSTQVRIAEADNTAQHWPNLGNQQSAIVIRLVLPFASVESWADDGSLCQLFEFTDLQPKLGPMSTLYYVTFTMVASSERRRARVRRMDGTLLGRVSILLQQTFLEVRKPEFGTASPLVVPKTNVGGQSLSQNWPPSAYLSHHSAKARCWQPIFGKIFADARPVLGRI